MCLCRPFDLLVTSHTGCVSRNNHIEEKIQLDVVTSHTGCVSRNITGKKSSAQQIGHIPHGMCE